MRLEDPKEIASWKEKEEKDEDGLKKVDKIHSRRPEKVMSPLEEVKGLRIEKISESWFPLWLKYHRRQAILNSL